MMPLQLVVMSGERASQWEPGGNRVFVVQPPDASTHGHSAGHQHEHGQSHEEQHRADVASNSSNGSNGSNRSNGSNGVSAGVHGGEHVHEGLEAGEEEEGKVKPSIALVCHWGLPSYNQASVERCWWSVGGVWTHPSGAAAAGGA